MVRHIVLSTPFGSPLPRGGNTPAANVCLGSPPMRRLLFPPSSPQSSAPHRPSPHSPFSSPSRTPEGSPSRTPEGSPTRTSDVASPSCVSDDELSYTPQGSPSYTPQCSPPYTPGASPAHTSDEDEDEDEDDDSAYATDGGSSSSSITSSGSVTPQHSSYTPEGSPSYTPQGSSSYTPQGSPSHTPQGSPTAYALSHALNLLGVSDYEGNEDWEDGSDEIFEDDNDEEWEDENDEKYESKDEDDDEAEEASDEESEEASDRESEVESEGETEEESEGETEEGSEGETEEESEGETEEESEGETDEESEMTIRPLRLFYTLAFAWRSPAPVEESDDVESEGETELEDRATIRPLNIPQPPVNAVQDQEIENLVVLFQALSLEDREDSLMADASECPAMDGIKSTSAQQDDARDRARRRATRRKAQVDSDMVPVKWTSSTALRRAISSTARSIRARECGRTSAGRKSVRGKMQGVQQSMPEAAFYESVQVSAYSPQISRVCPSPFTPPLTPAPSPPSHARAVVASPGSPCAWTECFAPQWNGFEWVVAPVWSAPGICVMA